MSTEAVRVCVNCGCRPDVEERGTKINRDARLGAHILEIGARLAALEKMARKTPPKTMLAERGKVDDAKAAVGPLRAKLQSMLAEHATLRAELGLHDSGLSKEYVAVQRQTSEPAP